LELFGYEPSDDEADVRATVGALWLVEALSNWRGWVKAHAERR
jgi:hypothetical protein